MPAPRLLWLTTAAALIAAPAMADDEVILLINPNSNDGATQSMAGLRPDHPVARLTAGGLRGPRVAPA